jgi:RsiW-degrading membrane proteinase PrsW (M82 family)
VLDWIATVMLGFAPGLFWLWYLRCKDRLEPEPSVLMLLVFVLGCGAAFVTMLVRPILDGWLPFEPLWLRDLLDAFAVTAGGEELVKFAAFFFGALWHRELDEPMDGIVYGAAAGLGFASVENILYIVWADDAMLIVSRGFTATLAHVACSGALGFAAGLARLRGGCRRSLRLLAGIGAATVALHGLYDYFLFAHEDWGAVSLLAALPAMLLMLSLQLRWSRAHSPKYHPDLA